MSLRLVSRRLFMFISLVSLCPFLLHANPRTSPPPPRKLVSYRCQLSNGYCSILEFSFSFKRRRSAACSCLSVCFKRSRVQPSPSPFFREGSNRFESTSIRDRSLSVLMKSEKNFFFYFLFFWGGNGVLLREAFALALALALALVLALALTLALTPTVLTLALGWPLSVPLSLSHLEALGNRIDHPFAPSNPSSSSDPDPN